MILHNSLTGQTEPFLHDNTPVTMYSCGPTTYAQGHIGNLAAFTHADTLYRALHADGQKVKRVMNFTDVDDKTIARSQETYPDMEAHEALFTLTRDYEHRIIHDMQALGVDTESIEFIRATESIKEMQDMILDLVAGGFAYPAEDGVYFDINAYTDSGKVYGQLTNFQEDSDLQERIGNSSAKKNPRDFALWKRQQPGEPAWDFAVDGQDMAGRPGWHIECSAMSHATLGPQIDIHTGGIDLKFPHHENEIAQSTAGRDSDIYATTFSHNNHLTVDGEKMSKSLGNTYLLSDLAEQGYTPLTFRMFILSRHYRSQSNYTATAMDEARAQLLDLVNAASEQFQPTETATSTAEEIVAYVNASKEELLSDLNTPASMTALSGLAKYIRVSGGLRPDTIDAFKTQLTHIDSMFGFSLVDVKDITDAQKAKIAERDTLKAAKRYQDADSVRAELAAEGIELKDTGKRTLWNRTALTR